MVRHFVTITHVFEAPSGAGIVAVIDQQRNEITISFQFRRGEPWADLELRELAELGKLFQLMAEHVPEAQEVADLFTAAGKVIG
jgi:hypothetical protein